MCLGWWCSSADKKAEPFDKWELRAPWFSEFKLFGRNSIIDTFIWLRMEMCGSTTWLDAMRETVASYRRMIDASIAQLTDAELHMRPEKDANSVAIILRHLGGNLQSRWTDFLTTDGEKSDRDRDAEFLDWDGDRQSLIEYFDRGWSTLVTAIESIDAENVGQTIHIRGELHTIAQALTRSITHLAYHVGQIVLVARMVHDGEWRWLTIAPGLSADHNGRTWGTKASRSVFANDEDAK